MAHDEGVKSTIEKAHLLEEVTCLLVHVGRDKHVGDFLKLILLDTDVVAEDDIGGLGRQATTQVESDSGVEVALLLLDLSSLGLLAGLEEPAEVVILELNDILMLVLLGNLDTLVPAVKLLVHGHSLFDLVMLDQDSLSLVELLVEDSHLGLDTEVVGALSCHKLVQLAQVVSLSNVTKSSVAALSDIEVVLLHSELSKSLPVGLSLWGQVELLENIDSRVKTSVLEGGAELNQALIELVRDGVVAIIDENFSLVLGTLDALNITLDLIHGDLIGLLDRVPHTEVRTVLGNNDIGIWDPVDELAVVEQALLGLLLNTVEVELLALVAEEELRATGVQLEVVNL